MPFEALPHTADWCLRVWASDLEDLFAEAARGMYSLAGVSLAKGARLERSFSTSADDSESLLVAFLSELLFYSEKEALAFDEFAPSINPEAGKRLRLSAVMKGAQILSIDKAIKAVTFHNMHIQRTERGYEVEIVFDV